MNDLCADIGYRSINHVGEQLCGDHVDVVEQGENSMVIVLADGLGSGVKASILSTLTSKIISTMMAEGLGLEDCVKFIGFRKDIKNLYKGSDLYVNSSQHEALSFLIIEAMAAGLPVIATDMGGNSDIVNDEAGCGMLVEYDNPDSMAVAMKCFLEDPAFAARCRENARRTIEDKFEIHKMARATYGVYEKALHD